METKTLVYDELWEAATADKAAKFKPRAKNEERHDFLARLVERISEVPQEKFDELSAEAQEWYNQSVDLLNEDKPLESPEGYGEADEADDEPEAKANGSTRKKAAGRKKAAATEPAPTPRPAGSRKKVAAKAAPKAKKAAAAKEPKEKLVGLARVRPREGASVGRVIREALVNDQALTADDLRAALKKAGFSNVPKSTVSTMTADIMRTLFVAAQAGLFKANPPLPKGARA